jgi:transposase
LPLVCRIKNRWISCFSEVRAALRSPAKAHRKQLIACDFHIYRSRHLVENLFSKLKAFRRIAARYDKTDQSSSAMIYLVGAASALR